MLKISVLLLCLFTFCSCSVQNCKIKPNYKEIGESALKNNKNLTEIEVRSGKIACDY
jgi:hypothetical protein